MIPESPLADCTGFDWDAGNASKSWERPRGSRAECEEVFFHRPLLVVEDEGHSRIEVRYYALGRTVAERPLFLVFTVRRNLIRVISARPMNRRERRIYERAKEQAEDSPEA